MMRQMMKHVIGVFFGFATVAAASGAAAVTLVGDDVTKRAFSDSFQNFSLAMVDETFTDGRIDAWSVYTGSRGGDLALLVLESVGGDIYSVAGVDARAGLAADTAHTFSGTNIAVSSGQILGLYLGDANVYFDFATDPVLFTGNGTLLSTPTVGQEISFTGDTQRDYSVQASVVPLPATALLLIGALGAVAAAKTRRRAV